MRRGSIRIRLTASITSLTAALDEYAVARLQRTSKEVRLPGQFLDGDGRRSHQCGLTAIALWVALVPDLNSEATKELNELCLKVMKFLYEKTADLDDTVGTRNEVKLRRDFKDVLVKRCLCLLTLSEKGQLCDDIEYLLTYAFRGSEAVGWPALLEGTTGQPDALITGYVLMAITDSLERFNQNAESISSQLRTSIEKIIPLLMQFASESAPGLPIHQLFYTNCLYRLRILGFSAIELSDIRKEILNTLYRVYSESALDPTFVGTEIISFYQDGDDDRYFRFNADVVLLESHFFSHGGALSAFQARQGKLVFDRVMRGYCKASFKLDANGQRATIYSVYHALRVLRTLKHASVAQPGFGLLSAVKGWILNEWTFDRVAIVRLGVATIALLGVAFMAYSFAPSTYAEGVAHVALLASFAPLIEYSVTKLTSRFL